MTKDETYIAMAAIAVFAYILGAQTKARQLASTTPTDPLWWLYAGPV